MNTRDAETLSQLVSEHAGRRNEEGKLSFEELAEQCIDPKSRYQPSANLLWSIASGKEVKINERLVGAIAAGLAGRGLDPQRVVAAAAHQYTGWTSAPLPTKPGDAVDDAVVRVARAAGVTPDDMPAVEAFFESLRKEHTDED